MNDRSCFSVLGCSSSIMASVFVINGVIPWGVILKPNHSIAFLPNSHFWIFIARFSLSSFSRILFNSFSCSFRDHLVITRMSSRNANSEFMPSSVLSIVFLNVAGISVSPENPFMKLYVPVARPPRMMKLQCFAIDSSRGIWL